ncbi:MAG TPA: hypothetical protein VMR14_12495 [Streptosporangiaceae bacterium]|nr:hypothetical protein [Streptosporangiaceae bacterium]
MSARSATVNTGSWALIWRTAQRGGASLARCTIASADPPVAVPSPTRSSLFFSCSLYCLAPLPRSIVVMPRPASASVILSSCMKPGEYLAKAGS